MSHQITTIAVGDRYRVGVHADLDAEDPRTLGDPATGAHTYRGDSRLEVETVYYELEVERAYNRFDERTMWVRPAEVTIRWARVFHQVTVVDDGRTLWWVDPEWMANTYPEVKQGTPAYAELELQVIEADRAEYQTWADGNVYGLTIERKVDWTRIGPGEPDRLTTWEDVDALWGIYFDDTYPTDEEALLYAATEIGDDEFRAAFSALNATNQKASA